MYLNAHAYSLAEVSAKAPSDIFLGVAIWREIPTLATWAGAFLTVASGLYILYREQRVRTKNV